MPRKSRAGYAQNWKEIAAAVKEAAGWRCVRCQHAHDVGAGYVLTVHHLDLDPSNNAWWNLVALCQRCHLQIQAKVVMERAWMLPHSEWFIPYVAGYYAHIHGQPEDRDYVIENAQALIALGTGSASERIG